MSQWAIMSVIVSGMLASSGLASAQAPAGAAWVGVDTSGLRPLSLRTDDELLAMRSGASTEIAVGGGMILGGLALIGGAVAAGVASPIWGEECTSPLFSPSIACTERVGIVGYDDVLLPAAFAMGLGGLASILIGELALILPARRRIERVDAEVELRAAPELGSVSIAVSPDGAVATWTGTF